MEFPVPLADDALWVCYARDSRGTVGATEPEASAFVCVGYTTFLGMVPDAMSDVQAPRTFEPGREL